jgi:hypothetical protein
VHVEAAGGEKEHTLHVHTRLPLMLNLPVDVQKHKKMPECKEKLVEHWHFSRSVNSVNPH